MKILTSRKGFTLIELLVVIGILAVLAAIAIPSVAGLIDRANKSADETNANEYTNAMEKFVSEYELFRQDIVSGTFDKNNMDAAQSRVYNITGAEDMDDIRALESENGLNGIRIDIDSKYAQNHKTAKAVMENYTKTSSSTFEPKQSDMTYWYNTLTGYTIVAEKDINTATLYDMLPVHVEYGNSQVASLTEWIDLSSPIKIPDLVITEAFALNGDDGRPRVCFCTRIPTKKGDITFDLSKIYVIATNKEKYNIETLDMQTATSKRNLDAILTDVLRDEYENSTEPYFTPYFPFTTKTDDVNAVCSMRFAFEYEENGITRYAYSAEFSYCYNDLISNV